MRPGWQGIIAEISFAGVCLSFRHRSLRVYCIAVALAARVYRATRSAPPGAWPVVRQFIRAATSVALNIAEGAGEFTPREKARFYRMARRAASETVAALDLLVAMNLIAGAVAEQALDELDEICAMLTAMVRTQDTRAEGTAVTRP